MSVETHSSATPTSGTSSHYELRLDPGILAEANRQVVVCNACRYCEGYCSVFPAVHRQRAFSAGDIIQLANLCHNCRGCYYACQYTAPHEFAINLPKALADARIESWQHFIWPARFAKLFQHHGVAIAAALVLTIALLFYIVGYSDSAGGSGFYSYLAHTVMVSLFAPAFLIPLFVIARALRHYWRTVGGQRVTLLQLRAAINDTTTLRNLDGGQGQGCNYEREDRYSNVRRWLHQATVAGFLLCFASTVSGTIMHYLLDMAAPYPLLSVPKLLGVPGGLLLTVGCVGLAWFKTQADPQLGAAGVWGGEMAFVLLLAATGLTGLILYAATGTSLVSPLLALHLGTVLAFFLLMPYSKMVHGFFRFAALVRDAQLR